MKTTAPESTIQTKNEETQTLSKKRPTASLLKAGIKSGRFPGKSVRPQGSMVKLKSFRPNRVVIAKSKSE